MDTVILKDRITSNFSDEEFFQFCADNRDLRVERNSKLQVIIMSPTTTFSGRVNTEVLRQLANWNVTQGLGEVFDSSTCFTLPDRSVLSPDTAWISKSQWNKLSEDDQNRFAPISPEFIIEVRSKSDGLPELQKKMDTWIRNGVQLAWLIDPIEKVTHIFRPNDLPEIIHGFDKKLLGTGPVNGFFLDLSLIKLQ